MAFDETPTLVPLPDPYLACEHEQGEAVFADEHGERTIWAHAVFCQCTLPIRALPDDKRFYNVQHGNVSLMLQAGHYRDHQGLIHEQFVPSGPKARILFAYIIDRARSSGYPVIDMGKNLYQFMRQNNVPVGSKNRDELVNQVRNITASDISVGMWAETAKSEVSQTRQFKVASTISFWRDKQVERSEKEWDPIINLSDDFMTILDNHTFEIRVRPLIELQSSPRAMDMYMWLTYRVHKLKHTVKISYQDLHSIFGLQTRDIRDFKKSFRQSIEKALPYVPIADVDFTSEKNHLIIRNQKHRIHAVGGKTTEPATSNLPVEGVFGDLRELGLSVKSIEKLVQETREIEIQQALTLTKQRMDTANVNNPAGFFLKALKGQWELPKSVQQTKDDHSAEAVTEFDEEFEKTIECKEWKIVRDKMHKRFGVQKFHSWFKGLELIKYESDTVVLRAPTPFIRDWIKRHYVNDFKAAWKSVDNSITSVDVVSPKKN